MRNKREDRENPTDQGKKLQHEFTNENLLKIASKRRAKPTETALRKKELRFLHLNKLVSNCFRYKLGSAAVSQELLIENLINLVCLFHGNLDVNVVFGRARTYGL